MYYQNISHLLVISQGQEQLVLVDRDHLVVVGVVLEEEIIGESGVGRAIVILGCSHIFARLKKVRQRRQPERLR